MERKELLPLPSLRKGRVWIISKKNNANEVCKLVTLKLSYFLIQNSIIKWEYSCTFYYRHSYRKVLAYRQSVSGCYSSIIFLLKKVFVGALCGTSWELTAVWIKVLNFCVFLSAGNIRQLLLRSTAAAVAGEGCYHDIYPMYVDGSCWEILKNDTLGHLKKTVL